METDTEKLTRVQREMEIKTRRELNQKIDNLTNNERKRYYELLNAARRNRFDKENPGTVSISTEERLNFIRMAKSGEDIDNLIKAPSSVNVDPIKMYEDWEGAIRANKGRPPIGGAPDD